MRFAALLCLASCATASATEVLTQHNDLARTGAVIDEKALSPATLKGQGIGKLFSLAVDGQIYAQPLVVTGLAIPGAGTHDVVFVATMRNMVYAFDAEGRDASPLWKAYLGAPMPYDRIPKDGGALLGQYNVRPYIGVTSTPVIDREKQLIYVVAKIAEPQCLGAEAATPACPVVYRIHALDLASGAVVRKSDIRIPMKDPSVPEEDVARRHLQRAALLMANHKVYAAFGAHQDAPPYQGWVIAFDADTLQQLEPAFCTTPGGEMGGVWQAGNGPAADPQGNIYIMTGNGSFDPDRSRQFGSTFVKLNGDLAPVGWFAAADVKALNLLDVDQGSSGPMLMPGTDELVGGGKDGKLFVLSQAKFGGQQLHSWWHGQLNPPIQYFQASRRWRITWLSWFPLLFNAGYHHIHGSPVYWNSRLKGPTIYIWPEEDNVKAFHYDAKKKFNTAALKGMMGNQGMPGGFLSISANGESDGILWAAIPYQDDAWVEIVRGTLRAFNADTLELLWSTDRDEPADHFDFAKYVPPTVANGRVYLATFSDRLNVYGLHSPVAGSTPKAAPHLSRNPRHRGHVKGASGHSGSGMHRH
jgi:outer membrane protein assembly factor BamB